MIISFAGSLPEVIFSQPTDANCTEFSAPTHLPISSSVSGETLPIWNSVRPFVSSWMAIPTYHQPVRCNPNAFVLVCEKVDNIVVWGNIGRANRFSPKFVLYDMISHFSSRMQCLESRKGLLEYVIQISFPGEIS